MSPEALLETLRLHGKSSVCCIEPRDAREWAEVVAALLAVQRYTPTPSPTPAAVESVDRTLELAARIVELEQEVARLKAELAHWEALSQAVTEANQPIGLSEELCRHKPEAKSVTQEVAEAYLCCRCGGQGIDPQHAGACVRCGLGRCGFCLEPRPAAELVNGECADRAACARGVQAAAGGAR